MYDLVKSYMAHLMALELCCKDGHYEVKGVDFRQLHVMFDQIINGIDDDEESSLSDMRDAIQEVFFLGRNLDAMSGRDLALKAYDLIPEHGVTNLELVNNAKNLLVKCLEVLAGIMKEPVTIGENDLFSGQARELQHRLGFLERTLS